MPATNPRETNLSPREQNELIRAVIEDFASRFFSASTLVYVGDTADKRTYVDSDRLAELGVPVDSHGKMPDVVLHDPVRGRLVVVEAATSHGPIDNKRYAELTELFAGARTGIVYVTAFPSRTAIARYLTDIAWQTTVWVADEPAHLIHFNGGRLLGPYETK